MQTTTKKDWLALLIMFLMLVSLATSCTQKPYAKKSELAKAITKKGVKCPAFD